MSLVVICCHSFYHSLSFVVIRCTTRCQSLSLVVICCTTRCHSVHYSLSSLSLVIICCHSMYHSLSLDVPLVVTRCTTRLSFYKRSNNQCPDYFNEVFCPVKDNEVATRCCNKKLKLPFCKLKLGMQSLSYVGPSIWNKLSNNLKTATSVNCFKHDIKKYFPKKLGKTEADIYIYA